LPRRTVSATALGALGGGILSLTVLALAAPAVIATGVTADGGGAAFVVGEGAVHLLILVAGTLAGSLLGAISYAVAKQASPAAPRVAPVPLLILGAFVGAVVGFAVARAALGLAADRSGGIITVTVFRAALVALVAGGATGSIIGGTVERLSRPEALGFGGEAWPAGPVQFARDASRAIGLPVLSLLVGVAVVVGLARVLLDAPKEVGLVVFGGVAAVVLLGAAFIASRPPRGGT